MDSGIYKITCKQNGKLYIGSSKNISKRWKSHINFLLKNKHNNPHLQSAWNLYGEGSFAFEIIELCPEQDLISREQYWMDVTKCYLREVGFNNCMKSDRPTGYVHTEEDRKLMSELKKGKKQSQQHIDSRTSKIRGRNHSEHTIKKQRDCKLGDKNPMYGRIEDQDHKIKRMKNLLDTKRWNCGLTKESDARIEKLGLYWKGKVALNAQACELVDKETGDKWTATSIQELGRISPISSVSISRLRRGKASSKIEQKYKLIVYEKQG